MILDNSDKTIYQRGNIMQSNKYEKARKVSKTGKYPKSFYTCMFMIPKSVQDKVTFSAIEWPRILAHQS